MFREDQGLSYAQWRLIRRCIQQTLSKNGDNPNSENVLVLLSEFVNNDPTNLLTIKMVLNKNPKHVILKQRLATINFKYETKHNRHADNAKIIFKSDALTCGNAQWEAWCNDDRTQVSPPSVFEPIRTRRSTTTSTSSSHGSSLVRRPFSVLNSNDTLRNVRIRAELSATDEETKEEDDTIDMIVVHHDADDVVEAVQHNDNEVVMEINLADASQGNNVLINIFKRLENDIGLENNMDVLLEPARVPEHPRNEIEEVPLPVVYGPVKVFFCHF